jgi:hypothetical protein
MSDWYLLFDGMSEDGRGQGSFVGRTTDPRVAKKHYEACKKDPYSIGGVKIVTDEKLLAAGPGTDWDAAVKAAMRADE